MYIDIPLPLKFHMHVCTKSKKHLDLCNHSVSNHHNACLLRRFQRYTKVRAIEHLCQALRTMSGSSERVSSTTSHPAPAQGFPTNENCKRQSQKASKIGDGLSNAQWYTHLKRLMLHWHGWGQAVYYRLAIWYLTTNYMYMYNVTFFVVSSASLAFNSKAVYTYSSTVPWLKASVGGSQLCLVSIH